MKKRLVFFLVLFFVKLFSQSNDNHSKEVFIKIKDNFNFNLENYKIKLSKKSKIDVDFNKNLLFNIFDKFKIKSIKKASKLKDLKLSKVYKITLDDSTNYKLFEIELNNQITIEYVEVVPTHTLISFPNDKSSQQWHFTNINAAQAWDLHTGTGSVVIAIVDDAIRLDHEDIAPNVWVNPNEIAGNGIDDDGNGYVDDINGYDVADGDNNPTTTNPYKTHGTHCAGIAAAKSNNGVGIASISSNCKIMAVKCTKDAVTSPNIPYAYEGLEYAIASNPDIISLSWGGGFFSRTYQLLFDYAHSLGIVVVAAAGNNSSSLWMYPASYNHVISVGATDINDKITYFSNFGSKIDVMAPGDEIYSSVSSSRNAYDFLSGTSMACPLVAGLCGLMKSYKPSATNILIEGCLKNSAVNIDNLNSGFENLMGSGRIDAFRALNCLTGKPSVNFSNTINQGCTSVQINFNDLSVGSNILSYGWTFIGANIKTSNLKNPVAIYSVSGVYTVIHSATNEFGTNITTKNIDIEINIVSATLSGTATINAGQQTYLKVDFRGKSPYSFKLNDVNYSNIYSNPNYILVSPNTTTTYRINSFSDANCLGQSSGNAIVTVNSIAGVVNTTIGSNCASTDGLVAYYPFDGNANDASGNGNNGTIFGATLTNDRFGNPNNAFQFNGALESDYIESDIVISGSFTISIWYKADVGSSIIDYPTMFHLFKNSNVRQETVINAIANQSGYGINRYKSIVRITNSLTEGLNQFSRIYPIEGEWNHTIVVYDDSRKTSSFYTNGILESEETFNPNFTLNSSIKARVGANYQLGSNSFFKGVLDEFRIYNRALTDCEIKKLYDCNSTCSSPPVNCTSTDGLVAYYPFDGNANDASGNGNNGTIFGGVAPTADRFGNINKAFDFNGFDGKIYTNDIINVSTAISISAWVYVRSMANGEFSIVTEDNPSNGPFSLGISKSGNLFSYSFAYANGGWTDYFSHQTNEDLNRWIHVALVAGNGEMKLYLDGLKVFTKTTGGINMHTNSDYLKIGYQRYTNEIANGKMDDIYIYSRVLTDCEIKKLYDCNSTCSSGLVAHYPFCGNANDVSGNNSNGTVSGATLTTDRFGNANSAYSFDGINRLININSSLFNFSRSNPFSLSIWIYPTNNISSWILLKNGVWGMKWNGATSSIQVYNGNNPYMQTNKNTWNLNTWYNIIITDSGNGEFKCYINNVIDNSEINSANRVSNYLFEIGGTTDSFLNSFFQGSIDDIKIYNKALSQAEITNLYNEPAPCTTTGGLVTHYPFCGNADDKSGNNNHGTVSGATLTTDRFGNANSAYSFDGVNDLIEIDGQNISLNKNISISLWIKTLSSDTQPSFAGIIDRSHNTAFGSGQNWVIQKSNAVSNGYYFSYSIANGVNFSSNYGETATISTNQDNWEHLVYTKNSNIIKCYKNGQLISTDTYGQDGSIIPNINENILIGSVKYFSNRFFKGMLDDIKIYSKALSQAEITALYNETAYCPVKTCPLLTITGATSFCKSNTGNLKTYSVNTIAGGNYFWFLSGKYIGSGSNISINWQEIGNYTLTVIPSDICQGNAIVNISVNCCSSPSIVEANFDALETVCGNTFFKITNNSTGNKFLWYFGENAFPKTFSGYDPPQIAYKKSAFENIKLVVSNNCGMKDSLTKLISIALTPVAFAGKDINECSLDDILLGAKPIGLYEYEWSPAISVDDKFKSNPKLNKNYTGKIYLQTKCCGTDCIGSDTLLVSKLDSSFTTFIPKTMQSICEDVIINVTSSLNNNRFLWNTGSTFSSLKVSESGTYSVKTYNSCSQKTDTVQVEIQKPTDKIPNVITPNGDKFNDVLAFYGCYFEQNSFSIQVFSRSGIKVYESDNYKNNWNAEGLPDGIYYFLTESTKSKRVIKGWIEIIR